MKTKYMMATARILIFIFVSLIIGFLIGYCLYQVKYMPIPRTEEIIGNYSVMQNCTVIKICDYRMHGYDYVYECWNETSCIPENYSDYLWQYPIDYKGYEYPVNTTPPRYCKQVPCNNTIHCEWELAGGDYYEICYNYMVACTECRNEEW